MDGLHLTNLTLATKSVSQSSPLLLLPQEIRLQIWNELLQAQPEAMAILYYGYILPSVFTDRLGEMTFFSLDSPREKQIQLHILLVCRLIYKEATPIFYANMVVITIPSGAYHPETLSAHNRLIECLRRSRPVNIQKIFFIFHADHSLHGGQIIQQDSLLIQATCKALSSVASYERLWIQFVDWSFDDMFSCNRDTVLRLLRGFGILHCQKPHVGMVLTKISEDLEWAMRRPDPTVPLWLLHRCLVAYLNKYDPDNTYRSRNWTLKEFFVTHSERAADELNADYFFLNWDTAIDYVLEVLGQGLTGAITSVNGIEDNILRRAKEEGDRMRLTRGNS